MQQRAARWVAIAYLAALPLAIFSEFYVPSQIVVAADAAQTVHNLAAHELLFRAGAGSTLLVFVVDLFLIAGLYLVLAPIDRPLAVVAALTRTVETALGLGVVVDDLTALRAMSGAGAFDTAQREALTRFAMAAHVDRYAVALTLAGIGSTLFCWLWLRSRYVPRTLALLGVAASVLLAAREFTLIVAPALARGVPIVVFGGPIFVFELGMGLWLLLRGLKFDRPQFERA